MGLLNQLLCLCAVFKAGYSHDLLAGHRQLVVVTTRDWEEKRGRLQLYERVSEGDAWVARGTSFPVVIGRSGLAWGIGLHPAKAGFYKAEGDGKSPAGVFALGSAFGFASNAEMGHLKIDYLQINPYTEAVDDPHSAFYNCIVDRNRVVPDWKSSEKMLQEQLYALGVVVHHNFPNPQAGAGSAIFFHVWRHEDSGTAGCTAMSQENLTGVLTWLDKCKNPVLVQLPIRTYDELQDDWKLPSR